MLQHLHPENGQNNDGYALSAGSVSSAYTNVAQHQYDALDNSNVHKYYGDQEVYVRNNKRYDTDPDDESKGSDDSRFKMS